jgi:autotransporter-associated beta strand protein
LTVNSTISGGAGGNGGTGGAGGFWSDANSGTGGGGGGGGGAGGYALVVTGAGIVTNTAIIIGGRGGAGGAGGQTEMPTLGPAAASAGGNGGDGGAGIKFTMSGASLINGGTIQGGGGGAGGPGGFLSWTTGQAFGAGGSYGGRGVGVTGSDLSIVNSGSINTGQGATGTIGNAIVFYGGSNVLTIEGGGSVNGSLVIASGLMTLRQTSQSTAYGNTITGNGAVAITSAAGFAVTLSAANSHGGGTTVTAGSTLAIGNSQALGTGVLAMQAGAALNFGAANLSIANAATVAGNATIWAGGIGNAASYTGTISDGASAGGVTKTGEGLLILSAAHSYSGATVINDGTLLLTGSTASSSLTTVNGNAVLTGTGTVGAVRVNSGGTFAPGALPGTSMIVAGNLAFQSGAIYWVQSGPLSSTSANVQGTASLAGNVTVATGPGSYVVKQSNILHATTLSGTFAGVNAPAGFDASLSYSGTDVTLNLSATLGRSVSLAQNHAALVSAHNTYFNNGGALPARFVGISALTGNALTQGLTQISGETPTGAQQASFDAMTQFFGMLSDPTIEGRGAAGLPPSEFAEADDARNAYAAAGRKRSGSATPMA